ncbi:MULTISPECIES: hypothetical protein [Streptomyces]|uniref:Uncharacterized protein n=2 Tax=Streptomyces TaxID=1883 RepID=A0ABU4KGD3_9ACTN|nr:hypothetical protein [Streptomyces roseolus]MDX2296865.1 hypothetical protein [Streptomyces roseolus]
MKQLRRRRWIWSPITSWQARRLARMTGVAFDEAWVEIRLTTHPDERHFALAHDVLTQVLLARSAVRLDEGAGYGPEAGTRCVPETGPRYAPQGAWRSRDGSLRP